ncbi:MAG: Eco57I restriction-modification methylase domain-containing protein [Negativicoccus succinicivorans]|uniref:Eco57I restriction-modification methylase domain-containing protein n=1 Tax=Negativicoccus succinicivorans TaxID=620903 RepID=UPI002907A73C|nr:Eco57I restriction-modification methylase domain-containing protein [Negativicoccus succinicivorans]MDU5943713.1 Eco57I restriction-modification methylase domain-containing protein [Negativicoccus succinicivorans]
MGKDKKLFSFAVGNPPYQIEQVSVNPDGSLKNYAPPVYNIFMDAASEVAEKVELIHPARFLFNAGSTPKAWNEKMLNDEHFKVLKYEPNSAVYFPGLSSPIKGGVAITYRDDSQVFGAIRAFAQFPEVNTILRKVSSRSDFVEFSNIVYSRTSYRLNDNMHRDNPFARYKEDENGNNIGRLSKGHDYDMASNIFERIPEVFFDEKPNDGKEYIQILGREGAKRVYKYIRREYVNDVENMKFYKVLVPQANGNGTFGETISQPVVEGPMVGNTETFISIGKFSTKEEAEATSKYISTKFARTLLSILKVTQNGNKPVWKMIPVQDFSAASDIDWSKSIHNIDLQLYRKYGLSAEEIEFIESNVKEME